MSPRLSDAALSPVADFVADHWGLDFRKRWRDLERSMRAAIREQEHPDIDGYIQRLLSGDAGSIELESLANHLTVGETYFLRDKRALEILGERVLPELANAATSADEVTIWSAGCSTGEEPYSIAMVLDRMGARSRNHIRIIGTDINTGALKKAFQGAYGDWSFRGSPGWVKNTYFQQTPGHLWSILPDIKKAVTFRSLNLMQDSYLSCLGMNPADVIFCRNVLMYFTPNAMREALDRLYQSLAPDGWLVVSPAETSCDLFHKFTSVNFGGVTFYKKPAARKVALPVEVGYPGIPDVPLHTFTSTSLQPTIKDHQAEGELKNNVEMESNATSGASDPPKGLEPEDALLLARTFANEGRLAEAILWCDQAIAADKMVAAAHYLKATIHQEQGFLEEALLCLRQAVYVHPHFVLGHFALANLALRRGKARESRKHFENVWLLLAQCQDADVVPESDGLSVGMLRKMLPYQGAGAEQEPPANSGERVATR